MKHYIHSVEGWLILIGVFLLFFTLFSNAFVTLENLTEAQKVKKEREYFLEQPQEDIVKLNLFKSSNVCLDETTKTVQLFSRKVNRDFFVDQIQELWVVAEKNGALVHQRVTVSQIQVTTSENEEVILTYDLQNWSFEKINNWVNQGNRQFYWVKKWTVPYGRVLAFRSDYFYIYSRCI